MTNRDDFPIATTRILAQRAGYKCSFPGCEASTIGPSDEGDDRTSSTGTACHISAAAAGSGSRRYLPSMSNEDRRAISNGIWMCQTHGKLIDTDEVRFSSEILHLWRNIAEAKARFLQQTGKAIKAEYLKLEGMLLPENTLFLDKIGRENELIGDTLNDSCVPLLWGDEVTHAIRDLAIEMARNSLTHGNATDFSIKIESHRIIFTDNGEEFSPLDLKNQESTGGGTMAMKSIINNFGAKLIVASRRVADINETVIAFITAELDILTVTPCYLKISRNDLYDRQLVFNGFDDCKSVYFSLPKYMCISDVYMLRDAISRDHEKFGDKEIVLLLSIISGSVADTLKAILPMCRLINV